MQTDMHENEIVDLKHIREIAGYDKHLEGEFINIFLHETERYIRQLTNYCNDGVCQEWSEISHTIKGGAANIGSKRLYTLCVQAQNANDPYVKAEYRKHLLLEMAKTFQAIAIELEQELHTKNNT